MKMKTILNTFVVVSLFLMTSCKSGISDENKTLSTDLVKNTNTANGDNKGGGPKFKFNEEEHDFGKIIEGEKVMFSFKFKNVGTSDLLISSANGSCGCTIPDYPKTPIAPGKEGKIDITFNSEGKKGVQNKTITIVANTQPNTFVLKIKSMVISTEK
jgi:hypothetical protein